MYVRVGRVVKGVRFNPPLFVTVSTAALGACAYGESRTVYSVFLSIPPKEQAGRTSRGENSAPFYGP